jgi:hypothetical protein
VPGRIARCWAEARRATSDVGPLVGFRAAAVRGRARRIVGVALVVVGAISVLAATVPAFLPPLDPTPTDVLILLPSFSVGVLVIAIVSATASGGGRELIPRDQAVAYPISPTTDHLGALLMAPLNIAWLLQAWALLGATAYGVGPHWGLALAQLLELLWLVCATALAQVLAWALEWVRRGPHGVLVVRLTALAGVALLAWLVASHRLSHLLDRSPTLRITIGVVESARGHVLPWLRVVVELLVLCLLALAAGAFVAARVARRPAREELRQESAPRTPRPNPASDLMALLRTDRVAIWRSVPLRRGLIVLAMLPGLVALAGSLQWSVLCILPGLVASGGALLFGVNSWCLDGRGALWRDALPVHPRLAFATRVLALVEVLALATATTLVMASLRAGLPTPGQLIGVLCSAAVVILQVVATSLRWSVTNPFPVDLRSARATPAPPLVMVGYSAKLALTTTVTGMLFGVSGSAPWPVSVLLALPFLAYSGYRLSSTSRRWATPAVRARVVATVAS